ncbi:MAG: endonuclease/exonuclease/phosphatase family protein [Muribaculaceae bacterium]
MKHFALLVMSIIMLASCSQKPQTITVNYATINMRYDNPDDSANNWKFRKERMAQFITDEQLDIFGTQELLNNQVEDLKQLLPGYSMVGVGRDDGAKEGEYAAIFYVTDRFEALDNGTFWLSETPDSVGRMGWDAVCTRIATWAKLQEKSTGKVFMAVNTHFDHVGVEARRQSALLIIDKIKTIVGDKPAIVTGDFNVDDQSEAYRTITTNEFVLNDAYKIAQAVEGVNYTWHEFGKLPAQERSKIDFIFVTPGIEVTRAYIPQEDPAAPLSDHNPHVATLQF